MLNMRIIIIANRLPIRIVKEEFDEFQLLKSDGGLATGLDSLGLEDAEKHWIGWPGMDVKETRIKNKLNKILETQNFHPVYLSDNQINQYYEGYSNSVLWPLFHYFFSFVEYDERNWIIYKQVNELFFEAAKKIVRPGDLVWVQDYQLMLLPKMLRDGIGKIRIGYFHHVPFPSYELFKVLPERDELLTGLLGADLIGFHTSDYMRHFANSVSRGLKLDIKMDCVMQGHNKAYIGVFPMGINYDKYHDAAMNPSIVEHVKELRSSYGKDNKLIVSVNRLDYSKGLLHQIKGFNMFLKNHPSYRGKVSLLMIIVPSRDKVNKYANLKKSIDESIGSVNGKYSTLGWVPIHYFYHNNNFEELIAMYSMSDIALVGSLRDGMNLVAKEYVATKVDGQGVLILSEMAGAAVELSDAILINPNDIRQIDAAIVKALRMPIAEQKERMERMQEIISTHTVKKWASDFISGLLRVCDKNILMNNKELNGPKTRAIHSSYRKASKRLLVFDYDGTLSSFKDNPIDAYPGKPLLRFLKKIASDSKNRIVISSGRDKDTLERWFGGLNIDLVAEHGAAHREGGKWEILIEDVIWEDEILKILREFTNRTPGSRIEMKKTALVWHFRGADDWLALFMEQQLINALIGPCNHYGLQIMRGNKIVEIKYPEYSKGNEIKRLLSMERYDFIMAMGDDVTDEDMFMAIPSKGYSIKIGGPSDNARYYIYQQKDVKPFLYQVCGKNDI
jgi:trehalose 6-phosphate synthase/phosphatase